MALFTGLGEGELASLAEAFDLGRFERGHAIAAGTINSNFALWTDRGAWFLRVNEGKALADVAWEAELVAALAERGVATPAPVRARDGRPFSALPGAEKWVSVFPWVTGHHLEAEQVTDEAAGALGAALAQLHLIGLALPAAWRRGSIYDHAHLAERHAGFSSSRDPSLARAIAVLGDELAAAGRAQAVRARATQGIIHGDLFRDNVLWRDGALVAILDFEQASGGSLAYDLAVCINDWCWQGEAGQTSQTGEFHRERVRAMLAGYQRVRPLSPEDREALLIELPAAAARFTITRITDVYLANVPNPEKDFRAFLARVDAWRGPALGLVRSLL